MLAGHRAAGRIGSGTVVRLLPPLDLGEGLSRLDGM